LDAGVFGALSALLGSVVGGSATITTAWLTQRTQGRRASVEVEIRKREQLYGEFISEGSKLLLEGLDHELESPERLLGLYALLNRIRLLCCDEVLAAADEATTRIVERYLSPNLSGEELRQFELARPNDPLKDFAEACRRELMALRRQA
jgi:hypothetical protein